jgi:hypothetical protein
MPSICFLLLVLNSFMGRDENNHIRNWQSEKENKLATDAENCFAIEHDCYVPYDVLRISCCCCCCFRLLMLPYALLVSCS